MVDPQHLSTPANCAQIIDAEGRVIRTFDYDSGLYENGLPSYHLPDGCCLKIYKNGRWIKGPANKTDILNRIEECYQGLKNAETDSVMDVEVTALRYWLNRLSEWLNSDTQSRGENA